MMNHDDRRSLRSDLLDELDTPTQTALPTDYQAPEHGERAVEIALEEWRQNILEPKVSVNTGPILIRYIRQGALWTWVKEYQNRKFAWCGCFAAYAWRESVSGATRKTSFPSTYRLQQWARGTKREISGLEKARAGDLLIVGKKKAWGEHITLIERIEPDLSGAWTVEGNAWGETPESTQRQEGVIRRFRSVDEVHAIYRPLESDK